jgi:hypothetical protein
MLDKYSVPVPRRWFPRENINLLDFFVTFRTNSLFIVKRLGSGKMTIPVPDYGAAIATLVSYEYTDPHIAS